MSKYGDWTRGEDEALLNILGGTEVARNILRGVVKVVTEVVNFITNTFKVVVNHTKTLADLIAEGKYDWVNENITQANFPIVGDSEAEEELALFHFNRDISSDTAIAEMEKAGYDPADIADLLTFGASQPELQRQFPIVALKSVWRNPHGNRDVPILYSNSGKRNLFLCSFDGGWGGRFRFLARRKYQK